MTIIKDGVTLLFHDGYSSVDEMRSDYVKRLSGVATLEDIKGGIRITYTNPTHTCVCEVTM